MDTVVAQVTGSVRWEESVRALLAQGFTRFIELGPGNVLTGMAKRTVSGAKTLSVSTPDDLDKLLTALAAPVETVEVHEGEHLFATERMVVSPAAGVFAPAAPAVLAQHRAGRTAR